MQGLLLLAAAAGCGIISADIFDIPIKLQSQTYKQDFGNQMGMVPVVTCSTTMNNCQQAASGFATTSPPTTATGRCDTTVAPNQCVADVSSTLVYPINLSMDMSFATSVGQKAVSAVRDIKITYGVTMNSLNFDIPQIDVYIGPQSAKTPTDSGVVPVDKIPTITAGTKFADGTRQLNIAAGSPAYNQLVGYIQNPKVPFVFLLVAKPTFKGGTPVPSGVIVVQMTPTITVGIPR